MKKEVTTAFLVILVVALANFRLPSCEAFSATGTFKRSVEVCEYFDFTLVTHIGEKKVVVIPVRERV